MCLRDIAEIVWKLAKSEEAALTYLKEAYDLSRAYKHSFHSCARGDMFYRRLMVLSEAGKTQQAKRSRLLMKPRQWLKLKRTTTV